MVNCPKCDKEMKGIYRDVDYRRGFMYSICLQCGYRQSGLVLGKRPNEKLASTPVCRYKKPTNKIPDDYMDTVRKYFDR